MCLVYLSVDSAQCMLQIKSFKKEISTNRNISFQSSVKKPQNAQYMSSVYREDNTTWNGRLFTPCGLFQRRNIF